MDERVSDERAAHSFPVWAAEETCYCGLPAAHKIEEVSGPESFHPLTAYVCCECFERAMGQAHETYPYDEPEFRF